MARKSTGSLRAAVIPATRHNCRGRGRRQARLPAHRRPHRAATSRTIRASSRQARSSGSPTAPTASVCAGHGRGLQIRLHGPLQRDHRHDRRIHVLRDDHRRRPCAEHDPGGKACGLGARPGRGLGRRHRWSRVDGERQRAVCPAGRLRSLARNPARPRSIRGRRGAGRGLTAGAIDQQRGHGDS